MSVPDVHEALHVVVPDIATARTLADTVASGSELGVALLDSRLACVWANRALEDRAAAILKGGALEGLVVSSGAVPRWSQTPLDVVRQVPLVGLELERGRERLSLAVIPLMDAEGTVIGMVGLSAAPGELVSRASWSRWLDRSDVGVLASDVSDRVVLVSRTFVEGFGSFESAERSSDQLLDRITEGEYERLLAAKWTFLGGRPVAGSAGVTLDRQDGTQAGCWQLTWLTVAVGGTPLLRVDLLEAAAGSESDSPWSRATDALEQAVTMVRSCPEPLLLIDRGRVVGASPSCERGLGYVPEDLVEAELDRLVVGESLWSEVLDELHGGLLETPTRLEVRVLLATGERVPAEVTVAPLEPPVAGRGVVLVRCLQGDRSVDDIATLTTMLSVSEVVPDARGRIAEPLDLIREALGAQSAQLIGFDPETAEIHHAYRVPSEPEGRDTGVSPKLLSDLHGLLSMTGGPVLLDAAQTGASGQVAVQHVPTRHDMSWLVMVEVDRPWTAADRQRLRRLIQVQAWIIERVLREQRTEALIRERMLFIHGLDCVASGVMVVDAGGAIIATNDALERLLDESDLVGRPIVDIVAEGDRQRLTAALAGDSRDDLWEGELVRDVGWSEPLRLRLLLEMLRMPDGSLVGGVGTVSARRDGTGSREPA